MSAGMVGMNVEEVRSLSRQMDAVANQIESEARRLAGLLSSTTWVGNDRTQFEQTWQSSHMSAIVNVTNAIRDAAQNAMRNAGEQEQVSST